MDGGGLVQSIAVAAVCVAAAASWWVTGSKKKESKTAARNEAEHPTDSAPVVGTESTKATHEHVKADAAATELKSEEQEAPRKDVTDPVRTLEQAPSLACDPVVEPSGGTQLETRDDLLEESEAEVAGVGVEDAQNLSADDEHAATVAEHKDEIDDVQDIPVVTTTSDPPVVEQQEREEPEACVASERAESDAREMEARVQDEEEEQEEEEQLVEPVEEQEEEGVAESAIEEEETEEEQQQPIEIDVEQAQPARAPQTLEEEGMVQEETAAEAIVEQVVEGAALIPEQVASPPQQEEAAAGAQEHWAHILEDDGEANDATSTDASCADHEELQPEVLVHADHVPRLEVRFLDRYSESNVSTDFSFDEATSTAPGTEDTASSGQGEHELALTPPYRPSGEWNFVCAECAVQRELVPHSSHASKQSRSW